MSRFSERKDEVEVKISAFVAPFCLVVLMTGDYPIVDFSIAGKIACNIAVIVAVGLCQYPRLFLHPPLWRS